MQTIGNPYPIFLGLDGLALELGYIYIGDENEDPETSPKQCWYDEAGTQSVTQPIRTIAGYPDRAGSPARIWTLGKYSMRVRDSLGNQVFYEASLGESENADAGQPYHIHIQFLGDSPGPQQVVCKHLFGVAATFEVDLPDLAYFHVTTNPSDDCVFLMMHNGIQYGTLTIDTSGDLLIECDEVTFAVGDRFEMIAPAVATSLKDMGGTIIGVTA